MLKQALRRAQAGQGQVVSLVGPPGAGKSRLSWEFEQVCREQGARVATSRALLAGAAAPDAIAESQAALIAALERGGLELMGHSWFWESARLARWQGDESGWRDGLSKALESAERVGASGHAQQIREEIG